MNYNLYVNYFKHSNIHRRKELDACLRANLSNPLLNVIVVEQSKRLTYSDYFQMARRYTAFDDINIIANLDIYFDRDNLQICSCMGRNDFYALCRWDVRHDGSVVFFNREDSQDVWVFKGQPRNVYGDFALGLQGCDNRMVYEAKRAGYNVKNPSLSIKTFHLHNTNIRSYVSGDPNDTVPGPHEKLNPTTL